MNRDQLNALRGLACLMLVSFHIVGGTPREGLQLDSGWARESADALAAVRMPLFACIAGFTHFFAREQGLALIGDKARRLLVPMLLVGTLFAVTMAITKADITVLVNWTTMHLMPIGHYWFLESLFIVIALWTLARSLLAKVAFTAIAIWAYVLNLGSPWLGITGAVYLAPFFALGWWWAHAKPRVDGLPARLMAWLALGAVAAIVAAVGNPTTQRLSLPLLVAGALSCAGLFVLRPDHAALRWLGKLSYVVFLFHVFFTAPTRMLLKAVSITAPVVHLLVGVLAAVAASACLQRILLRQGGAALWLIGVKPAESSSNSRRSGSPDAALTAVGTAAAPDPALAQTRRVVP